MVKPINFPCTHTQPDDFTNCLYCENYSFRKYIRYKTNKKATINIRENNIMKKDCNECINADSSICIYYCKKKSHFEKCPHNCMFCEQYGNCGLLKQRECQG